MIVDAAVARQSSAQSGYWSCGASRWLHCRLEAKLKKLTSNIGNVNYEIGVE